MSIRIPVRPAFEAGVTLHVVHDALSERGADWIEPTHAAVWRPRVAFLAVAARAACSGVGFEAPAAPAPQQPLARVETGPRHTTVRQRLLDASLVEDLAPDE